MKFFFIYNCFFIFFLGVKGQVQGDWWEYVGKITPRHSQEINGSNWSVGAETMDRNYTNYAQWKSFLGPLGVKHARLDGGWAKCEKTIGVYSWEWLDEIVFDMVNQSVKPWIQTSYGNPIYSGGGTILPNSPLPIGNESLGAWDQWVGALVHRYGKYVDEWEIWNEPDLNVKAPDYAALVIRTATVIRTVQPEAKIFAQIAFSMTYLQEYLEVIAQQGQLELVNTVTYHPYSYNPDSTYVDDNEYVKAMKVINSISPNISLYQGENGVANVGGGYGALSGYNWTDTTQTKWALRRMLGDFAHGTRSSYFSIANMCYTNKTNYKGLLEVNCTDLSITGVKPAYYSIQYLTSIFDDTIYQLDSVPYKIDSDHFSLFAFRNSTSNTDIIAMWNNTDIPSDKNFFSNSTLSISGININHAVWVDLRVGLIYDIPSTNWNKEQNDYIFSSIPCYDSVILIADLDALSKWE